VFTAGVAASPQAEGFNELSAAQIRQACAGNRFSDAHAFCIGVSSQWGHCRHQHGKAVRNQWATVKSQLCITDRFGET
jgi:hypothetical protein